MIKVGDYVRHVRQGPGRVIEVLPNQILVRQRSGHVFRVNSGISEQELEWVPPDGFVAQLFHRDYTAELLRANIEDVLSRILRDKHRRSLSVTDVREILEPFLSRESKKWATWW